MKYKENVYLNLLLEILPDDGSGQPLSFPLDVHLSADLSHSNVHVQATEETDEVQPVVLNSNTTVLWMDKQFRKSTAGILKNFGYDQVTKSFRRPHFSNKMFGFL